LKSVKKWFWEVVVIVRNVEDVEVIEVKEATYHGEKVPVNGCKIRWVVDPETGGDKYNHNFSFRYFVLEPGGEIPMHEHAYEEVVFMLEGSLLFSTEEETVEARSGDAIYTYTYEPHALKNHTSSPAVFTCSIDNV
jgi:quercetin dioxygenase-like cupin family protein